MGSKYKDELVQQLHTQEPAGTVENEAGETFCLYPLDSEDFVGAILYEDTEGNVSGTFYEDADELSEAWDELSDDDDSSSFVD